jgi:hypothetical protein
VQRVTSATGAADATPTPADSVAASTVGRLERARARRQACSSVLSNTAADDLRGCINVQRVIPATQAATQADADEAAEAKPYEVQMCALDIDGVPSLEQAQLPPSLRRILGWRSLTSIGVGSTIGAGIFVLTGIVSHSVAGPAISVSFVVAAVACGLAGLCYVSQLTVTPRLAVTCANAGATSLAAFACPRLNLRRWLLVQDQRTRIRGRRWGSVWVLSLAGTCVSNTPLQLPLSRKDGVSISTNSSDCSAEEFRRPSHAVSRDARRTVCSLGAY